MKPAAPGSGLVFSLAAGLAGLPLWMESPLWGFAATVGASGWAYGEWRKTTGLRAPLPELDGEEYTPLDVAIAWRTPEGEFPAVRRGWRAILTEADLWLAPVRIAAWSGGDRDYVRIPRLDVVGCELATEAEIRVRFLDEAGRTQEVRLFHVPRAGELARELGYEGRGGMRIFDLGPIE